MGYEQGAVRLVFMEMDSILGKGPRGSMIQDFARSFFVRNCLTIVKVRQFLIF